MRQRSPAVAAVTAVALFLASAPALGKGREAPPTRDVSRALRIRVEAHELGIRMRDRAAETFRRKTSRSTGSPAQDLAASGQPERLTRDRGKPKIAPYDDPSFFGEADEHPIRVPALAWRERGYLLDHLESADATFLSGKAGRIKAARFASSAPTIASRRSRAASPAAQRGAGARQQGSARAGQPDRGGPGQPGPARDRGEQRRVAGRRHIGVGRRGTALSDLAAGPAQPGVATRVCRWHGPCCDGPVEVWP